MVQIPRWWHWHRHWGNQGLRKRYQRRMEERGWARGCVFLRGRCSLKVHSFNKFNTYNYVYIHIYIYTTLAYTIIYIYTTLVCICMYIYIYTWSFIILQLFAASCSSVRKALFELQPRWRGVARTGAAKPSAERVPRGEPRRGSQGIFMEFPGRIWWARGTRPGKHTKNWWERSTMLFMGNFTISMVIFHSYVQLPEGTWILIGKPLNLVSDLLEGTTLAMLKCQRLLWSASPNRKCWLYQLQFSYFIAFRFHSDHERPILHPFHDLVELPFPFQPIKRFSAWDLDELQPPDHNMMTSWPDGRIVGTSARWDLLGMVRGNDQSLSQGGFLKWIPSPYHGFQYEVMVQWLGWLMMIF